MASSSPVNGASLRWRVRLVTGEAVGEACRLARQAGDGQILLAEPLDRLAHQAAMHGACCLETILLAPLIVTVIG